MPDIWPAAFGKPVVHGYDMSSANERLTAQSLENLLWNKLVLNVKCIIDQSTKDKKDMHTQDTAIEDNNLWEGKKTCIVLGTEPTHYWCHEHGAQLQ